MRVQVVRAWHWALWDPILFYLCSQGAAVTPALEAECPRARWIRGWPLFPGSSSTLPSPCSCVGVSSHVSPVQPPTLAIVTHTLLPSPASSYDWK